MYCKHSGSEGWCYETYRLCVAETDGPCDKASEAYCFVSETEKLGRACFTTNRQCSIVADGPCFKEQRIPVARAEG